LVDKYTSQFKVFGLLPFETEAVKRESERGTKYEKFHLLNEDQTYFLMTLVRNTTRTIELKQRLVRTFSDCRRQIHALQHGTPEQIEQLTTLLFDTKPEYALIVRCRKAGLTQMQTAGALRWGEKRVRLAEKKLISAGLLPSAQMTLTLEG